jgi:hypothetical protein
MTTDQQELINNYLKATGFLRDRMDQQDLLQCKLFYSSRAFAAFDNQQKEEAKKYKRRFVEAMDKATSSKEAKDIYKNFE